MTLDPALLPLEQSPAPSLRFSIFTPLEPLFRCQTRKSQIKVILSPFQSEGNIYDLGFGKVFLDMTPKANRGEKRYFGFHQINKFCASKGTIKKGNTPLEFLCTIGGNIKLFFWYGKQYDGSSDVTEVVYDSQIPLLGVRSKESKIWTDTCTFVHRAIIHNSKNVEATQESIKDNWINKMEHTCNRILFRFNEKEGFPGGSEIKNLLPL